VVYGTVSFVKSFVDNKRFFKLKIPTVEDFELSYVSGDKVYAKIIGLKEPLKIRVISCGPDLPYYVAKYLQKYLWGPLKSHKNFQLCGTPFTVQNLTEVIGSLQKK